MTVQFSVDHAAASQKVPENMPISKLLRHFQGTHQLVAFVIDEYGTVIGIVTLENVLEEIIGDVADDEFDIEDPDIVPDGPDSSCLRKCVRSPTLNVDWDFRSVKWMSIRSRD